LKALSILSFSLLVLCAAAYAAPASLEPHRIVENYWSVARDQQQSLRGASMEVEIDASLPKLQKHGRLQALRRISSLGRITYEALRFEGDGTVKNNVIARYLTAETEAQKEQAPSLDVTPENYKFKYKGLAESDGRTVHVFAVSPRKKRVGLYRGDIWIDAETYLRVRESGRFVKNPSIFLKSIDFVRKYLIRDGISVPLEIHSVVITRLVGKAELTIAFRNVSLGDDSLIRRTSLATVDGQ
jgi:hypothetical protein